MAGGLLGSFDDPKTMGLLSFAAPLLQAGGWSDRPVSFGQALGAGLGQAGPAMMQAQQAQQMQKMRAAQIAEMERAQAQRQRQEAAFESLFQPQAMPQGMTGGPTQANAAALRPPVEAMGMSPQQVEMLRAMGPEQGMGVLASRAFAKPERTVVAPGAAVLDANNKPVYVNPRSDRPTELQQLFELSGIDPRSPQGQAMARSIIDRRGMPPQTTVNTNVTNAGEKQLTETEKEFSGIYTGMLRGEMSAPGRLAKLDQLDALLRNVETGRFAETRLAASKALSDLGMTRAADSIMKSRDSAEAAQALANEMALELRNPENGAGMPGAMSDQDREFLKTMIPGLATTAEGRQFIVEFRRAMIQRERDVGKLAREYARANGGRIDEGFFDKLREFSDKNPIVPRPGSPEDAAKLRPGSIFIDPTGVARRR